MAAASAGRGTCDAGTNRMEVPNPTPRRATHPVVESAGDDDYPREERMKRPIVMLLASVALSPLPVVAQTVDEIVAKSLAARGGIEKIKAVQSERLTGRISFGQDAEGPFTVELKRPGKMREEVRLKGRTLIRVTDGESGWVVDRISGKEDPRPMSADEMRNIAGVADFEGPLVDYKAKGNQVELVDREKFEGKDAYKLMVILKDGQIRFDYIDCDSYLEVKWEGRIDMEGKEYLVESYFRDYKEVDGLKFAFVINSNTLGTPYKQKIVFEKIELNTPEDDARFGKPAP